MTERFDPMAHVDEEKDAEAMAKRREALETVRKAIRSGAALEESGESTDARREYAAARRDLDALTEADREPADPLAGLDEAQTPEALRKILDRVDPAPARALATVSDWTGDPEPREWLAPAWLPSGRAALFTGPGGGGKSLLALQLAAAVAGGDRYPFRCDPRGEAVQAPRLDGAQDTALFCTWEDEPEELKRRLAWAQVKREELGDYLHVANLAGKGPLWAAGDYGSGGAPSKVGESVEALIRELEPRLAVIDPTAGAYAANENDRAAVRGWLSHLGALAADTGAAILLIAHPPKDVQHAFSGSTDWRGGVRSLWTLRPETVPGLTGAADAKSNPKDPAQGRALTLDKANYAKVGRRAWLKLRVKVKDDPEPGDPPDLMRWEECTAKEAAIAYHEWRGWDAPTPKEGGGTTAGTDGTDAARVSWRDLGPVPK